MKAYVLDGVWDPKPEYLPPQRDLRDKRAVFSKMIYRNLKAGIVDVPLPKVGDDDVLIKVGACGVCGSDMHAGNMDEEGYTKYAGHLRLPVIMGHEFSGEIAEVGRNIKKLKPGDLIAVEQMRPCGKCDACKAGYFNSCREIEEVGLSVDGAFCEFACVPEHYCCPINDIAQMLGNKVAAFEAGALAEPAGVAYNGIAVRGKGIAPGTYAAIFGTGPIGLAAISLAKAAGAAQIFAIDLSHERLKLAKACGADYLLNPLDLAEQKLQIADVVLEYTQGIGCQTVVEAAGAPESTYPQIVTLMSINANVVVLGRCPRLAPMDLEQFIVKGCSLSGSIGTAGSNIITSVLSLMANGRIDMRKIITGRFTLENTQAGIDEARLGHHGKVMISQFYGN